MTDKSVPSRDFVRWVRRALSHLYDYAYLQNNPLAAMIEQRSDLDRVARAQELRRLLLYCIEALKPQSGGGEEPSQAARTYAILTHRYVDGMTMAVIARKRALSTRQAYREHEVGVEAVAGLLWDRVHEEGSAREPVEPESEGTQLQMAQAEAARLGLAAHSETLDPYETLASVLTVLAPLEQRQGTRIRISSDPPWPTVVADRMMLRQTLLNLLSHALNSGVRDIAISFFREEKALRVEMRGATGGKQLPQGRTGRTEQATVGPAVARALLQAQGGRLEIDEGEGEWRAGLALPTAAGNTILVIDDNADLVSLMQRYLASHDVTVIAATDGQQALRLAAELRPQIITLDVMMPERDGWEILQQLKRNPATQQIPVIVCSVLNEARLADAMGAAGYLTKPVTQGALLRALRHWLGPLQPAV